jgi:hypothetical protein
MTSCERPQKRHGASVEDELSRMAAHQKLVEPLRLDLHLDQDGHHLGS